MLENLLVVLLLAAEAPGGVAPEHPVPSRGTILRLDRQHAPRDWLLVTLDSAHFETRARGIDDRGLVGLRPRIGALRPADPLPWAQIERIDVLRHRRTRGALLGALVGGVGAVALTRSGDFLIGGALAGLLGGGALGRRITHPEELYSAPSREPRHEPAIASREPRPAAPAPDSTAIGDRSAADATVAESAANQPQESTPNVDVAMSDRVALRVGPHDLLRIQGHFPQRFGHVGSIDSMGLQDFRPEPRLDRDGAAVSLIPWGDIERIDKRAGSARSGAARGAIAVGLGVGVLTALVAAAALSLAGGEVGAGEVVTAGVVGVGVGAGLGALIGAGVGSAVPSWHLVYQRP